MSYSFTYHIQYRVKNSNMRNVINMRTLDRDEAVRDFKKTFGSFYIIERCFMPTAQQIKDGISLIQPVIDQEVREHKAIWCGTCTHSTFHSFAGYNHPANEHTEIPLVALYRCNICNTIKDAWLTGLIRTELD